VPSQYKEHYNDSARWDDEHYNDSARWDDEHYNDSARWDDEHYNDTAWWDKQYNEQYNDFDAVGWAGEATDEGGSASEEPPSSLAYIPQGGSATMAPMIIRALQPKRLGYCEPGVQEWFLDEGASPATAALLKRSFGGLDRSGGALYSRRKRLRRRMGRALDALRSKDARGFLSHCG
jgi:hypothetical protein